MIRVAFFAIALFIHSIVLAVSPLSNFEIPSRLQPNYKFPTERFLANDYEYILQVLKDKGMSLEHRNFFEHIIPHEELGFFGYHSSTQAFRIFQDIVRIVIEEKCQIEIKKDFHFLRIPGKSLFSRQSSAQFLKDYLVMNDNVGDQQEQLISMNYALFGNYDRFGECSIYYFTANKSNIVIGFQAKLHDLFDSIGMPIEVIPELFLLGKPLIDKNNAVLFQFFDFSHHNPFNGYYELVDQMTYPSLPGGGPSPNDRPMSSRFLGTETSRFTDQFRLVINNALILNPYSSLHIKRYERTDPKVVKEYERSLRELIKNLSYDEQKAEEYRQLLLNLWGQNDEG